MHEYKPRPQNGAAIFNGMLTALHLNFIVTLKQVMYTISMNTFCISLYYDLLFSVSEKD
ncbi:hypothetical protein GLOIN_2v1550779 [Rhizophagus irregularis DAOM 181602=DAOM 197198]|uniref:Uncharacterized protein n=1 Tax=Rhizophagus irregularis (strain DAOM 181602 / DAOM 197198 / MUCL 43194) TaxID=747089 RepID=A0A2P4QHD6_RHIID|nr:hypothetical protein GLOIN_2v1550779 [Rhizophagus irregularis DAOM 181602=DAOM 197198]POG77059.1 hypothetical protein GLOIN_2v1550779 [Rhizophagus irregularis DAOM 181602=DAOM 197198]|eukprot:XP_025183925.1 hypothetical protein GLOIN_2v1550779 [Rhizophagus irregularis DAOM 181602=DAOM 197198]